MSTIIRVKRSLNEDPLDDKIVLNCKRQKIDQNATILKFAGTVEKVRQKCIKIYTFLINKYF